MAKILFNGVAYNTCYANGTLVKKINFTGTDNEVKTPFVASSTISVAIKDSMISNATLSIKGSTSSTIYNTSQVLSKTLDSDKSYSVSCTLGSSYSANYFPVVIKTTGDKQVWGVNSLPSTGFIKATDDCHYDCKALPITKPAVITAGYTVEADPSGDGSWYSIYVNIKNPNDFKVTVTDGIIDFYNYGAVINTESISGRTIYANSSILISKRLPSASDSTGVDVSCVELCNEQHGDNS